MTKNRKPALVAIVMVLMVGGWYRANHNQRGAQTPQQPPADLILRGGRILTVDARLPEAQALAARGGKIVAIGRNETWRRTSGRRRRSSSSTASSRCRVSSRSRSFHRRRREPDELDLMATKSWDEIVHMVAQAVETAKPGSGSSAAAGTRTSGRRSRAERRGFPLHQSLDKSRRTTRSCSRTRAATRRS
jgi:hypothetical protein